QREGILSFDDLGCGLERRFRVAFFRASLTAARWGLGCLRGGELFTLREVAGAALRSHRTFVPNDLQRFLPRILGQPPVVGNDGDTRGPIHIWTGRRRTGRGRRP